MTSLHTVRRLNQVGARLSARDRSQILVIYDERLGGLSPSFRRWVARFPHTVGVQSGEELKSLPRFEAFLGGLSPEVLELSRKSMEVWAVGGGSVGDFAGYFASVWKRGVKLKILPSTWLSAIDSAHGGKTGLNFGSAKNLIGTFYPASEVWLVRELLDLQGEVRMREGMGELAKMALLDGGKWVQKLHGWSARPLKQQQELLWECLPPAIHAKWKWVKKDLRELTGEREVLNLGHTLGHVLELEIPLAHGEAVAQGLHFALQFGNQLGVMSDRSYQQSLQFLESDCGILRDPELSLPAAIWEERVKKDKKRNADGKISFVFLERVGRPVRKSVTLAQWIRALRKAGWVASS
jgi:3-dehydroquinate synthase